MIFLFCEPAQFKSFVLTFHAIVWKNDLIALSLDKYSKIRCANSVCAPNHASMFAIIFCPKINWLKQHIFYKQYDSVVLSCKSPVSHVVHSSLTRIYKFCFQVCLHQRREMHSGLVEVWLRQRLQRLERRGWLQPHNLWRKRIQVLQRSVHFKQVEVRLGKGLSGKYILGMLRVPTSL